LNSCIRAKIRVYADKMACADSAVPKHSANARLGASAHEWRGAAANRDTHEPGAPSVINRRIDALLSRTARAEAHAEISGY